MNMQTLRGLAFTAMVIATIGAIGTIAVTRSTAKEVAKASTAAQWDDYDWAQSEQNLRAIGAALQIYRQHNGVLSVAQRQNESGAGFARPPVFLKTILTKPGKPWTIDPSLFLTPSLSPDAARFGASQYCYIATIRLFDHWSEPSNEEYEGVWANRGEDVPIMMDDNMHSVGLRRVGDSPIPVLILRLDGRVERVMVDPKNRRDILLNK